VIERSKRGRERERGGEREEWKRSVGKEREGVKGEILTNRQPVESTLELLVLRSPRRYVV
jgi:hypothetical protein